MGYQGLGIYYQSLRYRDIYGGLMIRGRSRALKV